MIAALIGYALGHYFPEGKDQDMVLPTLLFNAPLLALPASDDPQLGAAARQLRLAQGMQLLQLHGTTDTHDRGKIREHLRQALEKGWFSAADKPLFEHGRTCLQTQPDGSLEQCLRRAGLAVPEPLKNAASPHS